MNVESFLLSKEELENASIIISKIHAGTYTLKKIYGPIWKTVESPTNFGTRFKASVLSNQLSGIELSDTKKGNNSTLYIIGGG